MIILKHVLLTRILRYCNKTALTPLLAGIQHVELSWSVTRYSKDIRTSALIPGHNRVPRHIALTSVLSVGQWSSRTKLIFRQVNFLSAYRPRVMSFDILSAAHH